MRHMKTNRFAAAMLLCCGLAASAPITALAQTGPEADCICEEKCTEETVDDQCPVCKKDYTLCQGIEAETEEETEEEAETGESRDAAEIEEPMGPLTPDGNMNLVDDYGSATGAGKQFITLTTKNGNYFYLIIDRDDSGNETVHFLNLVDESDILSLMDEDAQKAYTESRTEDTEEEPVQEETEAEEPEEEKTETKKGPNAGLLILLLFGVGGGIGFYFYKKTKGKEPTKTKEDPDIDYSENEEDEDYLETLTEPELPDEAEPENTEDTEE